MTAQFIAPVIPPSSRPHVRGHGRAAPACCLPVAAVPVIPAAADGVLYGFGRIDASGRVADRAAATVLGWHAGDRLTLTAAAGVVIARRDPGGMVTMPAKPYIVIPAALRRRCGLRPGDRVLLAVLPGEDALAAYSLIKQKA
jgi:AbrB family looped-hinge helix DNA binding protein